VGQFERNAILKGCELIAVGERCDTHGTRSDLILTLKGSHLQRRITNQGSRQHATLDFFHQSMEAEILVS
jgi:hypothetical protein